MSKETTRSPIYWKQKAAEAIGRPALVGASDEELEAAITARMKRGGVESSKSLDRPSSTREA